MTDCPQTNSGHDVIVAGLFALIGVLLGSFLGGIVQWHQEKKRRDYEEKSLALSFKGGISGLISILRERQYIDRLSGYPKLIEQMNKVYLVKIQAKKNYTILYESNVSKIGILKEPIPELISIFYTQVNGIIEDFETLGTDDMLKAPVGAYITRIEELIALLKKTEEIGDKIINEINEHYSVTS